MPEVDEQNLIIDSEAPINITLPYFKNTIDCKWHLQSHRNRILQIEFIDFYLAENQDFLFVSTSRDFRDDDGFLQFTGFGAPRILFSYSNQLWLHVLSNGNSSTQADFILQVSLYMKAEHPSCRKNEVTCGKSILLCLDQGTQCDSESSKRPLTADGIELRHNDYDYVDFNPNMGSQLTVNMILGEENTFTCTVKDSLTSTEIIWVIGGEVFERTPGSLVLNTQILVAQSSELTEGGVLATTGTINFTPTLDHQGVNLTCTGRHVASNDMGDDTISITVLLNIITEPSRVTLSTIDPVTSAMISYSNGEPVGIFTVLENQPINISCKAEDAEPNASLDITINKVPIAVTNTVVQDGEFFDTGSSWVWRRPTYEEHQDAVLECMARNYVNPDGIKTAVMINVLVPVTTSHMEIIVTPKPIYEDDTMLLEEGRNYTFHCITRNTKPIAWVQWNITGFEPTTSQVNNYSQLENGLWNTESSVYIIANMELDGSRDLRCISGNDIISPITKHVVIQTFVTTKGLIAIDEDNPNRQLKDGGVSIQMENIPSTLTCTAWGWSPRPNITWAIDGNISFDEGVRFETKLYMNATVSYLTFKPNLNFHNRSLTCTVALPYPYQESDNLTVRLHVYSIPPSNTSLNIFNLNQATNHNPISSQETIFVTQHVPQEFKCVVVGTKPEAFIQWTVGGREQECTDKIIHSSSSSQSLVDTTSILRLVPTREHHLQRLTCKTVSPLSRKAIFTQLVLYVTDTLLSTTTPNNTTDEWEVIQVNNSSLLISDPIFIGGLAGVGFILLCILIFIAAFVRRRMNRRIDESPKGPVAPPQNYDNEDYSSIQFDFPLSYEKLDLVKEINSGSFSVIFLARAKGMESYTSSTRVVVKTLKDDASETENSLFRREIIFTKDLKGHSNIMGIVGYNLKTVWETWSMLHIHRLVQIQR
ncbi:uncharacterized protein [Amphiura filiformis]|uniref:uncharacterized protein n=1 Tax=Amphiura filiformis TaxID=82378 RepID=UPI003B21DAAE